MARSHAEFRRAQQKFQRSRRVEQQYARHLRGVANQIDVLVKGFMVHGASKGIVRQEDTDKAVEALNRYSSILRPWAENVSRMMVDEIDRRDASMWSEMGKLIGREMAKEISGAPTGEAMQLFMSENVHLITSLPLDAAERVHKLTIAGISGSQRMDEVAKDILRTGQVTKSRAVLIARTETARTASALTMARSQHAGVTHYIWRTAGDSDVRFGHKEMNGKVCEWANPPAVNEGTRERPKIMHHHAGMVWNCRCYAEPILPEE